MNRITGSRLVEVDVKRKIHILTLILCIFWAKKQHMGSINKLLRSFSTSNQRTCTLQSIFVMNIYITQAITKGLTILIVLMKKNTDEKGEKIQSKY